MTMTEATTPTTPTAPTPPVVDAPHEETALDRVLARVRQSREAAVAAVAAPPMPPAAPAPVAPPAAGPPAADPNPLADVQSQLDDVGQAIEELAGNVQTLLDWMVEQTNSEMDQQPDMMAALPAPFIAEQPAPVGEE